MVRGIVLAGEALARVREAGGPLADHPEWLESLRLNDIPGVEVDGRVVAYWPVWLAVHAEPLWVDPAHRTPGTIRVLVETLFQHLRDAGVGSAFVVLGHADQQVTLSAALRLGFQRVPGDLYVVDLRTPHDAADAADAPDAPGESDPQTVQHVPGVLHGRSRRAGDLARHPTLREPPRQ